MTTIGMNFVVHFYEDKYKYDLMIRKLFGFSLVLSVFILIASCEREDKKNFDETLLYGIWYEGTLFYKYEQGGKGSSWDESEDYYEEDGLPFTWSLAGSRLGHIHTGSVDGGGGIAANEIFTVTELTATRMRFTDDENKNRTFRKVP